MNIDHQQGRTSELNTPRYIGDLQVRHFSSPRKPKRNLDFVKHKFEEQRTKIRCLTREKTRLQHCVNSLQDLLVRLRESNLLSEQASAAIMVFLHNHITN